MQEFFFIFADAISHKEMNNALRYTLVALQIVLSIMLIVYLIIGSYDFASERHRIRANYRLTKEEYLKIKDGDIILRHGYGFVSDMIVNTLNENFSVSHCAIVVKNDTNASVIHSVSQSLSDFDGVQEQNLRRFINDSKKGSVIVLRYKGDNLNHLIAERARYYLDKRVPFDNSFDINDSTKFFCTELIWRIFLDVFNVDIFEKKYKQGSLDFLKFDVFLDPDYFDIVFSHQLIKE